MPKHIQIRNVDDATYATLRKRAAAEELSLSAYLKRMLEHEASGPTMAELLAAADRRRAKGMGVDTETIIRIQREMRDRDDHGDQEDQDDERG